MAILLEGPAPLPWCAICGMHMHAAKMIRHLWTDRCNWLTEMRMYRRDAEIEQRAGEMKFSFYDKEDYPLV